MVSYSKDVTASCTKLWVLVWRTCTNILGIWVQQVNINIVSTRQYTTLRVKIRSLDTKLGVICIDCKSACQILVRRYDTKNDTKKSMLSCNLHGYSIHRMKFSCLGKRYHFPSLCFFMHPREYLCSYVFFYLSINALILPISHNFNMVVKHS